MLMLSSPYTAILLHSFPTGIRSRRKTCDMISMIKPAMKNRTTEITNGCATSSPILVTVDADAQQMANNNPIATKP
jgi:hypothetical protein